MSDPGASGASPTSDPVRPLFLLADSQLLFWKDDAGSQFLARVRDAIASAAPKAAYLGASNGDVSDFYDLFVAAMEGIGIGATRMIPSQPSAEDRAFFEQSDVILLAGGDAARGARVFRENGLGERIVARYAAGAVLIGVSAGAMQLGLRVWSGDGESSGEGFGLAGAVIGAHDEPEWAALTAVVEAMQGRGRGLGIPAGGGVIVHADLAIEPVRKAVVEIRIEEGVVRRALLMPGTGSGAPARRHNPERASSIRW